MAKNRKKTKARQPANQPVTVHRYSAEAEDKKDARKKLKVRSIIGAVIFVITALLLMIIF